MGVDGIFNDRPATPEARQRVEQDTRDPRYGLGRGASQSPPASASSNAAGASPLLGDDRLQLSPEPPANPFQALLNHRRRRRRKRGSGDAADLAE
jgi:hypothetical protein